MFCVSREFAREERADQCRGIRRRQVESLVGHCCAAARAPTVGPPLAELQLVAINEPVDESKFVVAKSLTEDGRIGKIVDAQGLVVLRPMLAERWTPISREMRLKTGDWLRTDLRGANAAKIRLSSDVELTAGPGTLIEIDFTHASATAHGRGAGGSCRSAKRRSRTRRPLLSYWARRRKLASLFRRANRSVRIDRDEKIVEVKRRRFGWRVSKARRTTNRSAR